MEYNLELLKKEIQVILNRGWIKGEGKGTSSAGLTFESLIGKTVDNLEIPDYHGIEIKTKYATKHLYMTLFNATPDSFLFEIKRIHEKYGYPDKKNKNYKVFNVSIYGNTAITISEIYMMKLYVDQNLKQVVLKITDKNNYTTDTLTAWSFEIIHEKLVRKFQYLLFVKTERKWDKGDYYRYSKAILSKLKDFDEFLKLIESGDIRITFKISVFRSGKRIGQIHDHGTSFDIHEGAINKLFDTVYQLG